MFQGRGWEMIGWLIVISISWWLPAQMVTRSYLRRWGFVLYITGNCPVVEGMSSTLEKSKLYPAFQYPHIGPVFVNVSVVS